MAPSSTYSSIIVDNGDKYVNTGTRKSIIASTELKEKADTASNAGYWTFRPTNTAVLYCIATKNIYIDQRFNYSTSESVVGTWIDGKPLYQITFSGSTGAVSTDVQIGTIPNVGQVVNMFGAITRSNGRMDSIPSTANAIAVSTTGVVTTYTTNNNQINRPCIITIQYTKTTD